VNGKSIAPRVAVARPGPTRTEAFWGKAAGQDPPGVKEADTSGLGATLAKAVELSRNKSGSTAAAAAASREDEQLLFDRSGWSGEEANVIRIGIINMCKSWYQLGHPLVRTENSVLAF
jgi:hypothetical protein